MTKLTTTPDTLVSGYFLTLQQRGNVVSPHNFLEGITFKDFLDI